MTTTTEEPTYADLGYSDADFTELLIRNLARDPDTHKLAQLYKLTGRDFMVDDMFGCQLYKEFIDSIMSAGGPIDKISLAGKISHKLETRELAESQFDDAELLLNHIYEGDITPKEVQDRLKLFLKKRRISKAILENAEQPDQLAKNVNAIAVDLDISATVEKAVVMHPFAKPVFKSKQDMIGIGISAVDDRAHGLCLGDYGLIVGYSGGGKTVMGTNIVSSNATEGNPAMFISLEEDEIQISQRFYSRFFEINYTDLHRGLANIQLQAMFEDPAHKEQIDNLHKNLCLVGMKGLTPVTADQIFEVMVRKYEETGFAPMVAVIDQLQFVEAMRVRKGMQGWELEEQASVELDELSHKTIGGRNFALWVLHQAKGKLRRHFSRDEIDGFKGIIHKSDLTVGIGRDGIHANEVDIFSLKVRHCQDFSVTVGANFKFMQFVRTAQTMSLDGYSTSRSNPSAPSPAALPPLPENGPPVYGGPTHA